MPVVAAVRAPVVADVLVVIAVVLHPALTRGAPGSVVVDAVMLLRADGALVQAEPLHLLMAPRKAGHQGIVRVQYQRGIRVDSGKSIYNVYNILAAWSVCSLAGVDKGTMARVINNYILKNGRMVRFTLGGRRGTLLTSKHENSVAYDTNLGYIARRTEPCQVLIIVASLRRRTATLAYSPYRDMLSG